MILLHRLTPFALSGALFAGFALLVTRPSLIAWSLGLFCIVVPVLLSRLLLFEFRRPAFWVFLGVPLFLIASAFLFFLFLEADIAKWLVSLSVVLAVGLYAENLFTFYHLPSAYQAYSLEYLSLVISIMSAFFFTSAANGAHLFLRDLVPLWIPAVIVFVAVLFSTLAMFWVSKVGFETSRRYALFGALLMTELFVVLTFLPTSFVANAAAFATLLYLYLGLMRAHVLEKLGTTVVRRYAVTTLLLLFVIFGTAQWL